MAEQLKRRIGPGLLTLYGIGIMVGAGIYVLTGAAAGEAGLWAPLAFVLAAIIAVPTALTFAELSVRIPEAAADSAYIEKGLGLHWLAMVVGWINIIAGTVAAAAVLRGGVGYLLSLVDLPFVWATVGLGLALTAIAIIGVVESLAFAALLTLVEVIGLLLVIGAGFAGPPVADWSLPLPAPEWSGVMAATIFAFFAYIGFDDMANMAEETRDPGRTMPRAILAALAVTGLLYCLVSLAAVRIVPREVLAGSERPLALVWEAGSGTASGFLSAIAVAAALNGVLAQVVMASRVLFGLGKRSPVLGIFRHAHPRFGTPVLASILVGLSVIGAALALPVATLAGITSQALLIVFAIVNAALIALKRQGGPTPFDVPRWVPWLGLVACLMAFAGSLLP
ncbi:APC family permease [Primorskyibacter sp. 2E233]|uniref:APC family permease n=1 Tax=Primorskyibacter sp. 2E233 TaxID=3413431 RepID=UPI003BF29ABB